MTVQLPEFLQTQKYSAQRIRQMMRSSGLIQEGIVHFGDFQVKQRGAGANMSVDITAGDAWVQGDDTARQGLYHVGNDAVVNLAVPAANATNPRIDQVVLRVYDSTIIGGAKDEAVLELVAGTATAGATLANRTGAAALPSSALRLADIVVPALDTTIETAQIGNPKDPRVGTTGYPAGSLSSLAEAPPPYAYGRPALYIPTVKATRTAAQSINNATLTPIQFNAADDYDLEAMHDTVTNNTRLTAKTAGFYSISANVVGEVGFEVRAFLNGGGTSFAGMAATLLGASLFGRLRMAAGDFVEVDVLQSSGVAKNVTAAQAALLWEGP